MAYLLNLIISCCLLSQIKKNNNYQKLLVIIPVVIIWTIIVGGQYYVGADYGFYIDYFSHPIYSSRFEPIFTSLSRWLYSIGIKGQGQFFFYAFFNAVIVFIAANRLGIKHWALFYFLLITVSTFFNNQMNGIRQCIATVLVFWGFVELYKSKLYGILLIVLALGFHYSSAICLAFLYISKEANYLTKFPKLLLIVTAFVTLLPIGDKANDFLFQYLPSIIKEETAYETMYYNSSYDYVNKEMDFIYKISKLLLFPIYWLSLKLMDSEELTEKENTFYKFGLLSYSLRCLLLMNNLVGRFSFYFWIPSIIPIYLLARYYWRRKDLSRYIMVLAYSSALYFIKIFLEQNEYKYDFYLFHTFPLY